MWTDIGLREARSNRSHRTRECRGSINIGPPGQIAFESVEKKKGGGGGKKICYFGNVRRGHVSHNRVSLAAYHFAVNSREFQKSRRRGKLIARECVHLDRRKWLFFELKLSRICGISTVKPEASSVAKEIGKVPCVSGRIGKTTPSRTNNKWMLLRRALVIATGKSREHDRIARLKFINVRANGPTMVARLPQQVLLLLVLGE